MAQRFVMLASLLPIVTAAVDLPGTEVSSKKLALKSQARNCAWTTDHGSNLNLGSIPGLGPGGSAAYCRRKWFRGGGTDGNGIVFLNSGVSSTTQSAIAGQFLGDSAGTFWFLQDIGANIMEQIPVPVEPVFETDSVTGMVGFLASPSSIFDPVSSQDFVIAPSLDGYVYAMSQMACTENMVLSSDGHSSHSFQTGPGQCGLWATKSQTNYAWASPSRTAQGLGMVFAIDTDPLLNTGSSLHALNLSTGVELWPPVPLTNGAGTFYGAVGIVPATSPLTVQQDRHLIMAFGSYIVVIDSLTGAQVANTSVATASPLCPIPMPNEVFASSVSVLDKGDQASLFVQSTQGNLWSFTMTGNEQGVIGLTCAWQCSYSGNPNDCAPPQAVAAQEAHVPGGWHQRTTRKQRDELLATIRSMHTEKFGVAASASISAQYGPGATFHGKPIVDGIFEVSAMARALPYDDVSAIVTASGYTRQGPNGKPVPQFSSRSAVFGGTSTLSTPAVCGDGTQVAMTTYGDGVTNSPLGVVFAQTLNGIPFSFFTTPGPDVTGNALPYARSRSSPAWDNANNLYVAADWDFSAVSLTGGWNDTQPALVVLSNTGSARATIVWSLDLGTELSGSLGLISPTISDAADINVKRVVVAGSLGSLHAITGCQKTCPTQNPLQECSGHGVCNGGSGNCTCASAWANQNDPSCATYTGCDRGTAQPDGSCVCTPCFLPNTVGGQCSVPFNCMNGGFCENVNNTVAQCLCPFCYGLDPEFGQCTIGPKDCGPGSTGCIQNDCQCAPCYVPSDDGLGCMPQPCGFGTCVIFESQRKENAGGGDAVDKALEAARALQIVDNPVCVCEKCYSQDTSGVCSVPLDCGEGGYCFPDEGVCENAGDLCWKINATTEKYDTRQLCSNHGTCNDATGHCTCTAGWSNTSIPNPCAACDACHTGVGTCASVYPCGGHGTCTLNGSPNLRLCVCSAGWLGANCDVQDASNSPAAINVPLVAGVGVPVGLLVAAALGFLFMRGGFRRGPGYAQLRATSSSAGFGNTAAGGAAAPNSFGTIAKSAGFDSDAAKAAVARLSTVAGTSSAQAPISTDTSSLLGSRGKVVVKNNYGGL